MAEPTKTTTKRKAAPPAVSPEKAETLRQLRANVGQLSTSTMRQLEKSLP